MSKQLGSCVPGYKPAMTGPLYANQDKLPKLPVPSLEATLPKYLKSIEPLLTPTEYENTVKSADEFSNSAIGKLLQDRLLARAQDPTKTSWLIDWWNDLAYLGYRDPVVPFVSYFYAHKNDKRHKTGVKKGAAIVSSALQFWKQVTDGTLPPEMARTTPLDSSSYQYMFNSCRIPHPGSDHPVQYNPETNKKITVARNGIFYILDICPNGIELSVPEIETQLEKIIQDADGRIAPRIGIFTGDYRDTWAKNREMLISSGPNNKKLLAEIESSIFLLCLDSTSPVTQNDHNHGCWHGDGFNRFFDKPCEFIVFENGKSGFLGEHSMMDGTPTCRLNEFVVSQTLSKTFDKDFGNMDQLRTDLPSPLPLLFETDVHVLKSLKKAHKTFDYEIARQHLYSTTFHGFGKQIISKHYGFSPDAFAQMIIQHAYYKLHGRCVPTYEPAQTRKFLSGRTEACRVLSTESLEFVKTMENPYASDEEKINALKLATKAHSKYSAEAAEGLGVDRHLLGLRLSLKPDEELPALFKDPVFSLSSTWKISTSNISSKYFLSWGWSEVVGDGYGIAYSVVDDNLSFNVTCARDNTIGLDSEKLCQCLNDSATDLRELLAKTALPSKPKL
ncbi:Carnitine O-acetyltransferase, mitochondrial [Smittium mucronatum]|uniref:Carnitine O-acetyltransferase, mitochondrial n=1 Tax=Smittium mucronatum TaxID=133383 RepID=A0A1R0GQN1_9FUNG|nr:Carnitine O-acetyltransferase, mitochondrial [Smittium mucronatum]OLY80495.1 Carnitine O-acetyltransferase, mitochondrial [Smittium mucronatum]